MSLITIYCGCAGRTSVIFDEVCSHSIACAHFPQHSHFQECARLATVGDELFTCRSVACEAIRVIVFKWQNLTPHGIRQVCFVLSLSRTTCFDPYPPAWKKKVGLGNWKGANGSMHRGSLAAVRVYIVCGQNKLKFWWKEWQSSFTSVIDFMVDSLLQEYAC